MIWALCKGDKMRVLCLISFVAVLLVGCQQREVVYDDYIDSFRYKPETEWDYLYLLDKGTETKVAEHAKK